MVFIYSTSGIFVADKYDPAAPQNESEKFGNVLKLEFDTSTNQIQLRTASNEIVTNKPVADGDIGEGPPLLESELVSKLSQYCVLKNQPGTTTGQTVNGDLDVSGNIVCNQVLATSDERLKSDIEEADGAALSGLRAYSYTLAGKRRYGIMAQEALEEPALEPLVGKNGDALAVDYNGLTALLLAKMNAIERKLENL